MRKTMKSSAIKTIVAKVNSKASFEFEVDGGVFDDVYVEAATRAVERLKHDPSAIVRPIIEVCEKKDSTKAEGLVVCNSYWALVNAGMYEKAERMRELFKAQHDKDLKEEPLRGSSRKSK
jgi:hypothetical protein